MKKSFMTRALATGLSLAMACSLSVADVSTAAAASLTKVTTKTITEGKSTKVALTTAAAKKYKIKSYKLTATAKQFLKAEIGTAKKAVTITAKKNAVTNAGATQKNLKITLNLVGKKDASVKKTAKVNVVVKAKPVEKLTMTAAATKVKAITVTFNKAVEKPALTVTKGTAKPAVTETVWNEAGTEATIKMAGKLTKGTYTVATTVGEEALTADAIVEKDETLTSFELVGTTLKAASSSNTTKASIEYKALNQYGEMMSAPNATATVAPGTKTGASENYAPTASKNGKITVDNIPDIYCIAGSEFSIVIVDNSGVTFTGKAVYGASAKAKTAEPAGLYNIDKAKVMDMTEGDKPENYLALFKVTDQYGDPYVVADSEVGASNPITAVAASGLTNVKVSPSWTTAIKEVDGTKYLAVPLARVDASKTSVAGDFSLTLVNNQLGVIATPSYTIAQNIVISNIDISADAIYAGQNNTMTFTVTDANGNAITSYDTLKSIKIGANNDRKGSANGTLKLEKNVDGTGKLVYAAPAVATGVKSEMESFTVTANDITSSSYLVKTVTLTRLAQRTAVAVVGVSNKVATSTAVSGGTITVNFTDLLIEDQYGNIFTSDELKANTLVSNTAVYVTNSALTASQMVTTTGATTATWVASGAAIAPVSGSAFTHGKVIFTAPATSSAIETSFNININGSTNDGYTFKLAKVANGDLAKVTELKIEDVNKGYAICSTAGGYSAVLSDSSAVAPDNTKTITVVVSGKVGGKKVYITAAEADVSISVPALGAYDATKGVQTGKATVKVVVNTSDGPVTLTKDDIEVSNQPETWITSIKKIDDYACGNATDGANVTTTTAISAADVVSLSDLTYKPYTSINKYGNNLSGNADSNIYSIALKKVTDTSGNDVTASMESGVHYAISHNDMKSASFQTKTAAIGGGTTAGYFYTFNVTVTAADGTKISYDICVENV